MIDTLRGSLSVLALVSGLAGAPLTEVDDQLPLYAPVEGVSGALTSVGSDTMNDVMTLWMEGFLRLYPGAVRGSIEGRGSATAPPALLHGRSNLAPMSRRMNEGELRAFEKQRGYRPTEIAVGIDMLAVFVHADNPLRSLDLVELDAIFSRTREGGAPAALDGWSDLGLDGVYARQPIRLLGRNLASGTHRFFAEHALFGGEFREGVEALPGGDAIVNRIARDRYAMGYGGIGFLREGVRAVPLAPGADARPVPPSAEHAYTGDYPLARLLFLYVDLPPGAALDPLRAEFLRYVFSRQGQEDMRDAGYYPVDAAAARSALKALGLASEAEARS